MHRRFKPHHGVIAVWFVERGVLAVMLGFFFLLGIVNIFSGLNTEYFALVKLIIYGLITVSSLLMFITLGIEHNKRVYYLLPEYVHIKIGKKITRIPLNSILDAKVTQNKIEKLFNIGKVHLRTIDSVHTLEGVPHPRAFEVTLIDKTSRKV